METKTEINNHLNKTDRREFLIKSTKCAACLALMPVDSLIASDAGRLKHKNDTKKIFIKKGTCSQTYFYLLNREFGNNKVDEEKAADPLAGGIMQKGYQCGLLSGAALAVGAESYRRFENENIAISKAITSTQSLIDSFQKKAHTTDCRDFTNVDFSKKFSTLKLIFFKSGDCLRLAKRWTSNAFDSAHEGLSEENIDSNTKCKSCATELARRMGASDEEMITVSGFAGGLGLSGNACGALSSAIWLKTLYWLRNNPDEPIHSCNEGEETLIQFEEETGGKYLCSEITGKQFNSIQEHTEFIEKGGCQKLLDILAQTKAPDC